MADNQILDIRMNKIEFRDRHTPMSFAAISIAENNPFGQINDQGNRHVLFDESLTIESTENM